MDEKLISSIVRGLLSGSADIIQPLVDKYFTEDIVFEHPLFAVKGKADFYKIYRGYYAYQEADIEFSDFLITDTRAVFQCVQHARPRYLAKTGNLVCRSTILLHFREEADGATRIYLQTDHWSSIAPVLWSIGGWAAMTLGEVLMKPFNKSLVCFAADLWDFLSLEQDAPISIEGDAPVSAEKDAVVIDAVGQDAVVIKAAAFGAKVEEMEDTFDAKQDLMPPQEWNSHVIAARMSMESYTFAGFTNERADPDLDSSGRFSLDLARQLAL